MANIFITGCEGYLGQRLCSALAAEHSLVGLDIRPQALGAGYHYYCMDIRAAELVTVMIEHQITHVVHLASILQPSDNPTRDHDIDVNGSANLLQACVTAGVQHITVTSSGAAYGYYADNPAWLVETDPLRGHPKFSYSEHKRQVEALLAQYRQRHPQLQQLVLRPGTVLGEHTNNPITQLFTRPRLLAIRGSDSPFVFIWDEDLVAIVLQGVVASKVGIYNLAGDGALSMTEIAQQLQKPLIVLPAALLQALLWLGKVLRLTRYGPEQVDFLRYRPVLSNSALKQQFGFVPSKTSAQVLAYYAQHNIAYRRSLQRRADHD